MVSYKRERVGKGRRTGIHRGAWRVEGGRGRRWNRRSLIIVNCAYEYSHYLTCVLITARYNFALRYLTWITSSIYHYSVFHVYYTAALCYIPSRPPHEHTYTRARARAHWH
jgi:hypothetical protein